MTRDSFDFRSTDDATGHGVTDVMIKSWGTGGSADAPVPTEEITLNYDKIIWSYSTAEILDDAFMF